MFLSYCFFEKKIKDVTEKLSLITWDNLDGHIEFCYKM